MCVQSRPRCIIQGVLNVSLHAYLEVSSGTSAALLTCVPTEGHDMHHTRPSQRPTLSHEEERGKEEAAATSSKTSRVPCRYTPDKCTALGLLLLQL